MTADDALWSLGATEIVQGIRTGRFSSQEIAQASMEHVAQTIDVMNTPGLPWSVVPAGISEGLPQAVQVVSAPFRVLDYLAIGEQIESGEPASTPLLGELPCR